MGARYCAGFLVCVALLGCGDQAVEKRTGSIDTLSTGTVVVRNPPPTAADSRVWLELVSRIGSVDGEASTVFGRISDVAISPAGNVYVLDGLASEIRSFDAEGGHLMTFGHEGDGPGEFRGAYAIAFDSEARLWVVEERARRYQVFDEAGAVIRTFRRPIRWPVTRGVLRLTKDGSIFEHGWWADGPGAAIRMSVADEVLVSDTVPLPPWDPPSFPSRGPRQISRRVPLVPLPVADVGPDGQVWIGSGDSFRLERIGERGDTSGIIVMDVEAPALSDAERQAARDTVALAESQNFIVDASLIPAVHPPFIAVVVAENGELWVRRAAPASEPSTHDKRTYVYDLFDPIGRYVGTVKVGTVDSPAPAISGSLFVGVSRDELGIEYVEVYRIVRREE
jgi:hypothetical protein